MEEKSQNLILMVMMMLVCSCRPVALPHWLLPGLACRWLQLFQ